MAIINAKVVIDIVNQLGLLKPPFHLRNWRLLRLSILIMLDVAILAFSYWGAFVLRLDDFAIWDYRHSYFLTLPILIGFHLLAFLHFGMYRQVWRFGTYNSALMIAKCMMFGTLMTVCANFFMARTDMPPRSVPVIFFLLGTSLVVLTKFSWRAWAAIQSAVLVEAKERCVIYGAGAAGDLLARHALANPKFPFKVVGFIDDDKNKRGRMIHGLRILGTSEKLRELCDILNVKMVILAMHAPEGKIIRDIVTKCREASVKPLIMPNMANSLEQDLPAPRAVDIRDLLRRAPKNINNARIENLFKDSTVLVTGAGGSIGAEVCRQIFDCQPRCLVLMDSSEFNLYKIEQELWERGKFDVEIRPVLGSVVNRRTVDRVFRDFRPDFVLHAAAYKHVPMVECNPMEGVVNNILGTRNVAEAAIAFGTTKFLLISTDKAVRPTNVMGATKRCCEVLIQALSALHPKGPVFCAVRFGNVLGSSGSVIPRFLEQIQNGGPVTVTHPDVTRYFMLTSEAVGLVLQSITMSENGEIFVLNMGDSVRICEMAKDLIRLAGKEPGKDIDIVFTGLRPGEKLYEELILEGAENHTTHDEIFVATPHPIEPKPLLAKLASIVFLAESGDDLACLEILKSLSGCLEPQDHGEKYAEVPPVSKASLQ